MRIVRRNCLFLHFFLQFIPLSFKVSKYIAILSVAERKKNFKIEQSFIAVFVLHSKLVKLLKVGQSFWGLFRQAKTVFLNRESQKFDLKRRSSIYFENANQKMVFG